MDLASQSLNVGCLDDETLEQFKVGRLTEQDLEAVAAHLAVCFSCEERLAASERSKPDPLVLQIRKCVAEAPDLGISLSSLLRSPGVRRPISDGTTAETIEDRRKPEATEVELDAKPEALRIAQYELRQLLGSGGMGQVYLAWDTKLKRTVALKVIKAKSHTAQNALARFHREAKAIAKLDHAGIVQLYDFGETEGVDYLCMEHVEGGTLYQRLRIEPKLTYREAAALVRDLALAMHHAHQQNIIHRDLKPGNILLTAEGKPKIADFGLAKMLDEDDTLTRTNVVVGTPIYMAPEQASGDAQRMGPLSDQYALGAILYEMLTGTVPFRGKDNRETLAKVQTARLLPPSTLRPDVPKALEAICLQALSRDPRDRYRNAKDLAEDLYRYAAGRKLESERTLQRLRQAKFVRLAVAAALLIALGWTVCMIYAAVHDPQRGLREHQSAMAAGQAITLVGEQGYPAWHRWANAEHTRTSLSAEGYFFVHTWSWENRHLELMPRIEWPAYRIRATIRHDDGAPGGSVGVYLANSQLQQAGHKYCTSLTFTYNDIRDPRDYAIAHSKTGNVFGPKANFAELRAHCRVESEGRHLGGVVFPACRGHAFTPAVQQGQPAWRHLEIVVEPAQIQAAFDHFPLGTLTREDWHEHLKRSLESSQKVQNGDWPLPEVKTISWDRAEFGLYIPNSSATFRNVTIEPIPEQLRQQGWSR